MQIEKQDIPKPDRTIFRIPGIPSLRIPLQVPKPSTTFSSAIFLIYGFAGVIVLGAIMLVLPVSSKTGQFTSPIDALFTATSAVCVTGLVVLDTGTHWNTFGQGVLLALFQIGGLGFITGATVLLLAMGHGLGLREKLLISDSMGMDRLGGLIGIVARVAVFSVVVEGIGVAIFYLHWMANESFDAPLWTAVFQSVSAFNNCGMDIFGSFKSLADYRGDIVVVLTTSALIIIGGIGYLVFEDVLRNRHFKRLCLETKLVLLATASLLILGTLFYLASEFSNPQTLGLLQFPQSLLVAFFQSVNTRTAGFTAINIGGLNDISLFFTMLLMFIGGAAGSAAGGIKVNTLGVLVMTAIASTKGSEHVGAFGREFTEQNIYRAVAVVMFYSGIIGLAVLALSVTETFQFNKLLFETFSALGNVGLTAGITPDLSIWGRLIIIAAMFIGRLGPLTFAAALVQKYQPSDKSYPHETVRTG